MRMGKHHNPREDMYMKPSCKTEWLLLAGLTALMVCLLLAGCGGDDSLDSLPEDWSPYVEASGSRPHGWFTQSVIPPEELPYPDEASFLTSSAP